MNCRWGIPLALLCVQSCALFRPTPPQASITIRPAGVIRKVNAAERYVIFESTFLFEPGQAVHAVRDGRRVASLQVHSLRQRPFYAADILEGAPRVDDLVE